MVVAGCDNSKAMAMRQGMLLAIPSCLTAQDEDDIIHAFDKVLPVYVNNG